MRANSPDVIDHRQAQNIISILKLWTPDATARISPATQFDAERIALEKHELAYFAFIQVQARCEEKKAWNETLTQYEQGKLPQRRMHTVLGRTPRLLQECGAADLPIKISKGVIRKIIEKHKISSEELRKLPAEIEDPLAVFESNTVENSIVVLTEILGGGQNAVVTILMNAKEREGRKINAVSSTYGRPPSQIGNFIRKGLTLYINKQKSRAYLRSGGLQLPTEASKRGRILTEEDVVDGVISGDNVNRNFEKPFHPVRWIKQGGEVFGWFNPNTGEIVLREGCSATSVMEALWHTTFYFANTNAPKLYLKMLVYAQNAPHDIRDDVSESYPMLRIRSNDFIEKVGALWFSKNCARKLKKVTKSEQSLFSKVLRKLGKDEVNLGKVAKLPSKKAVAALANAFVRRKHLAIPLPALKPSSLFIRGRAG